MSDYLLSHSSCREALEDGLNGRIGPCGAPLTTNKFARMCFDGVEPPEEKQTPWDFTPCIFLENNSCSIYPVRPFMCRAFVSVGNCAQQGTAEVASFIITASTVMMQIIEHLDHGSGWGNMFDVLQSSMPGSENMQNDQACLATAQLLPGFLIPPEEEQDIQPIFKALENRMVQGLSIAAWVEAAHKKFNKTP